MAHKILGVDLGTYSVKVVVLKAGFRQSSVVNWLERTLPPALSPEESVEERGVRGLGELLRQHGLEHEVPYATLSGEALSMRVLDFPFQGLKRADLDKAVGAELEATLPHDLDELVYAFEALPKVVAADPDTVDEAAGAKPAAAPVIAGTRLLAAATTRERVTKLLDGYSTIGAVPHGVLAAPAAYARACSKLHADAQGLFLVDVGHSRTNVCVIRDGKAVFARTISRGGRHVTQAIARVWSLPFEDAERFKHTDGFIASTQNPAPTPEWARVSDTIKAELGPLLRELRQTLAACRSQTGIDAARTLLVGGGSRINGMWAWLADELAMPVNLVDAGVTSALFGAIAARVPADTALLALGVALEGATGRPAFDLRSGGLAYKQDFSFLRARAGYLAVCGLLLVAFFAGSAYASLYKLRTERDMLEKRLEVETTEAFGSPATLEELDAKLAPKKEVSPLPKMTAFDIMVEISRKLPPRTEGKLDVVELEIEPKKVFIKGVADSSATIEAVTKKLKEIECFTDIQSGREDTVSDGKQFSLTIPAKCMQ